jgi:hypothetical protein
MWICVLFLLALLSSVTTFQHVLQHPRARELKGKSQYGALYDGAHISTLVDYKISYFHHGIVVNITEDTSGNKDEVTIVHFSGVIIQDKNAARIQTCNLEEFTAGQKQRLFLIDYENDSPEKQRQSAIIAKYHLENTEPYDLIEWNCETFATYCRTEKKESEQVKAALELVRGRSFGPSFQGASSSLPISDVAMPFNYLKTLWNDCKSWIDSKRTNKK